MATPPVAVDEDALPAKGGGAWAPLRHPAFALLWGATVLSLTGTWMNDMGAAWLMGQLHPSPAMVALTQAATTAPVFCFALIAGVLADRYDRRTLMLVLNGAMGVIATALAVVVFHGLVTPTRLLFLTFLLNTGAAFLAPVWLAVVPSLVPARVLPEAFALNSLAINIARAIGPALAGAVIATFGLWAPFTLNAATFAVVSLAIFLWRPTYHGSSAQVRVPLVAALGQLAAFTRGAHAYRGVLVRAGAFFLSASCLWALLPVLVRDQLALGAEAFGLAMGSIGLGAVLGALGLPRLRAAFTRGRLVALGAMAASVAMLVMAISTNLLPVLSAAFVAGAGWIAVLSTFHIWVQSLLPEHLRGRGSALFLTVFFGAMTSGSLAWGAVASQNLPLGGVPFSLAAAGLALMSFAALLWCISPD